MVDYNEVRALANRLRALCDMKPDEAVETGMQILLQKLKEEFKDEINGDNDERA